MKPAKIYTRTGDRGTTGLGNRDRIEKSSSLISAIGDIDELNSALGIIIAHQAIPKAIAELLTTIQQQLFELGSELCFAVQGRLSAPEIHWLEQQIDQIDQQLTPIKYFILPGGCETAAYMHLARSICRRAERSAWQASQEFKISESCLIYLNRLSDLLFTMARFLNQTAEVEDTPWRTVVEPTR